MESPLYELPDLPLGEALATLASLPKDVFEQETGSKATFTVSQDLLEAVLACRQAGRASASLEEELEALDVALSSVVPPAEDSRGHQGNFPATPFDRWADTFLADRYASDDHYRRVAQLYNVSRFRVQLPDRVRGFAGFVALVQCVQRSADRLEQPRNIAAGYSAYLEDAAVRIFMDDWYGFSVASESSVDIDRLSMHKIGTTSFLLHAWTRPADKSATDKELALKCLIPRYSEIRPIKNATLAYYNLMRQIRDAGGSSIPHVKEYNAPRFIAMDFINGETLRERSIELLAAYRKSGDLEALLASEAACHFLHLVVERLLTALSSLAVRGYPHLDLSPYNVLVGERDDQVALVDFGRNYLVDEVLRGGDAYERIVLYIAPELIRNDARDDYACDLFSLGMILLDLLTGGGLRREKINDRLMELWRVAPGLAEIVEGLTANEPRRRREVVGFEQDAAQLYITLSQRLADEMRIASATVRKVAGDDFLKVEGMGMSLLEYLMVRPPEIGALLRAAAALVGQKKRDRPVQSARAQHFRALAWWSRIYILMWSLVLFPAVALTLGDVFVTAGKTPPSDGLTGWIASNSQVVVGHSLHNIPGRAIGVTTALIAVAYYMRLFATIDLRRLRRANGGMAIRVAPVTTRFFPLIAVCAQGVTVFYDPRLWAYTAGIGGIMVSMNNWVWRRLVHVGKERFGSADRLAGDLEVFEKAFRTWWWLMGLYSVGVLVAGLLVRAGIAHDEAIDAVVIAGGVNLAKLYAVNVTKEAGTVHSHLARAVAGLTAA